jgi:hypothetical protein
VPLQPVVKRQLLKSWTIVDCKVCRLQTARTGLIRSRHRESMLNSTQGSEDNSGNNGTESSEKESGGQAVILCWRQ